jgi:DNA anti-recombination protein RmuC
VAAQAEGRLASRRKVVDGAPQRVTQETVAAACEHGQMNAISLLVGLLAGAALGALIGYLYARSHVVGQAAAAEHFQALAGDALDQSARRFLEMASGRLEAANARAAGELDTRKAAVEHMVQPLQETLARVEIQLRETDEARVRSVAALAEQVMIARQSSDELRAQTQALVTALRRPEARGRWGEMQLRRVVEMAGMSPRCDFDEQVSVGTDEGTQRPDMVIRLAGGKNIVVDSKVSLAAYLEAAETTDETVRQNRLDAHARHLREHVDRLAAKAYWAALSPAPEFVVLFIPGEAFLAPALEHDSSLLEHAITHKVHIATPTTLVTMLRTAQYAWQQEALSENARAVFDLGRELYDRIASMGKHVDGLGKALTTAVSSYNRTIGSLEGRVLVSARKLNELGVVDAELKPPTPVEETVRALSAPDLIPEAGPELVPGTGPARADKPAPALVSGSRVMGATG